MHLLHIPFQSPHSPPGPHPRPPSLSANKLIIGIIISVAINVTTPKGPPLIAYFPQRLHVDGVDGGVAACERDKSRLGGVEISWKGIETWIWLQQKRERRRGVSRRNSARVRGVELR